MVVLDCSVGDLFLVGWEFSQGFFVLFFFDHVFLWYLTLISSNGRGETIGANVDLDRLT